MYTTGIVDLMMTVGFVSRSAQKKLDENKLMEEVVGQRGGQPHSLYGKVFCGECGAQKDRQRPRWREDQDLDLPGEAEGDSL